MNDTEKRRRKLLERTRNIYNDRGIPPAVHPRYGTTYHQLYDTSEEQNAGTLGIRIFICITLFIAFTIMDHKETTVLGLGSEQISQEIHQDFDISSVWKNL